MPPRKKQAPQAPSTMKELKDTLWKAADKLRGSLSASQYKDVILGLVFLKYVSDAYDERREAIRAELAAEGMEESQIEDLIDDPEQYQGYGVFVVPVSARWKFLAENTKGKPAVGGEPAKNIGQLIDEAMDAVMKANPTLGGTLPRLYNKDNIDQRRLGELIDLFNSARFSRQGEHRARDLMGEVYEYFLGNFARAEGKRGGEFFTPPSVVKVIVEVLEPSSGRVYDPCCGSGGMFVQTEKFIYEHDGDPKDVSIYGQESIEETWRMAKMNLAIHGIDNKGLGARWSDTFARDQHPDVQMDYVMANLPFNIKDWARNEEDPRWRFGVPPANNANYAWIPDRGPASAPGARADLPHRVRLVAAGAKVSAVAETAPLRVQLIAKTDFLAPPDVPWTTDADGGPALVEFAGRACYQSWSKPNPKTATNAGYLRHIIDVGHFSVLEHASVSFYITGISRSCTHELIRHRHFSYSQLSQRYVPEKDSRVVVPPGMEDDADLRHILTEAADAARATYSELLAKLEAKFADQPNAILRRKQARQAARAVLPNATETRIVVTGNYRAWRHFIAMRASEHADVEIRRLAIECLRQLAAVAPAVFADFEVTTLADGTEVATSPLATEA